MSQRCRDLSLLRPDGCLDVPSLAWALQAYTKQRCVWTSQAVLVDCAQSVRQHDR